MNSASLEPEFLTDVAGQKYKMIAELLPVDHYGGSNCDKIGVIVDVETTGTDPNVDKITEFAFLPFMFNNEGAIGEVLDPIDFFNDPGFPIPKHVVELTGITDEMVKGHHTHPSTVHALLKRSSLMIAHNAKFDRQMIEKFLESHGLEAARPWICSASDIDWKSYGISNGKLDYLAYKFGFYFEHHRAVNDCRATLHLLAATLPSGSTAFNEAISRGLAPRVRIVAVGSPFETKDVLKHRQYRWSPEKKIWWKEIPLADVESEQEWLQHDVYKQGGAPQVIPIPITERFKEA